MIKLTKILGLCAIAAAFSLGSCVKEVDEARVPKGDEEVVMTLTATVPVAATPQTRAMTSANEQTLTQVKVLAFNSSNEYLYVRDGVISNNNASGDNGGGSATITFTAKVSATNVSFVVIANANAEVTTALGSATAGSTLKSAILSNALLSRVLPAGTAWNATTGSYTAIPMYGETTAAPVSQLSATTTVTLTRILARINVSASAIAPATFQLTSVRLYNTNRGGFIAPGYTPQSAWAYLHTPPTTNPPLLYTLAGAERTNNILTRSIYTFERPVASSGTPVVLVVAGKFGGSATDTYYRIDMKTGSPAVPLSMARNHSYTVDITSIDGIGYATAEEAYSAPALNIAASVQVWNEHDYTGIVYDGHYMLGVNKSEFEITYRLRDITSTDNILTIRTDYPNGWTATVHGDLAGTTSASWLTLSDDSGDGNSNSISLLMSETSIYDPRTAYVHIRAGRLVFKVKVTQEGRDLYVGMFGGELVNHSGVWEFEQEMWVQTADISTGTTWGPATAAVGAASEYDGKGNTYYLNDLSTTLYPPANLCFKKNLGWAGITGTANSDYIWYLPAQNQLLAIWIVHNSYATTGKSMASAYYWSATEGNPTNAWRVNLGSGLAFGTQSKSTTNRVRCVRGIKP